MDHKLLDEVKQLMIVHGELRRHETVNLLWSVQFGIRLKENNDVRMRKAPLLKLNDVKVA